MPGGMAPGRLATTRGNVVFAEPNLYAASTNGDPAVRDLVPSVLIHEITHTRQDPKVWDGGGAWQGEGGAEAFTRYALPRVARQIGLRAQWVPSRSYASYLHRVLSQAPPGWVTRGQFVGSGR
jgi:hypothetical protein